MSDLSRHSLAVEALAQDPRIAQAKKLLQSAVQEHTSKIDRIKGPDPLLQKGYEAQLAKFAQARGVPLYYPYLGSGIGNGALVELLDGSVKYDMICGIGVHYLGHHHLAITSALVDAALSDVVMQGNLQQNGDGAEAVALLLQASKMDHCFLSSSGAMATENALKIAFQKRAPACRLLAFDRCFMGRTLALSQVTDKPAFREGLPSNLFVDYLPFYDAAHPEESTAQAVKVLIGYLSRHPKEYAAMCFELVQGEGGFNLGSQEFFTALMQILKQNDVAVIVDEVQTFGRTPQLFAFQHYGLEKYVDIVTLGKLSQFCATLFNAPYKPRLGLLSQTFTSSTAAIRSGIAIIQELLNGGYFGPAGKIERIHSYFASRLQAISQRHPHLLQGPFGIGAMIAFTPFGGDKAMVNKYVQALFKAGVIAFIAGENPARVRFLVPVGVITLADIDAVTKIVEETLVKNF